MIYTGDKEITVMLGEDEIYGIYAGDLQIYPTDFGTLTGITLENLTWVTNVSYLGGTATSANCSFDVYAHYDSGKSRRVTKDTEVTGSLVVSATTAMTVEAVGTLVLTASYEGFTDTDSVTVYQSAVKYDNVLVYTTTNNQQLTLPADFASLGWNANYVSHTFNNGSGVITFDDDLTTIPANAFSGQSTLATITIPITVTSYGNKAFMNCSGMTEFLISSAITSIGTQCFYMTSGVLTIESQYAVSGMGRTTSYYDGWTSNTFTYRFVSDRNWNGGLGASYMNFDKIIITGDTITYVGASAFLESPATEVVIGDNVTFIGGMAFARMGSSSSEPKQKPLQTFTFGKNVATIGMYMMFYGVGQLTRINYYPPTLNWNVTSGWFGSSGTVHYKQGNTGKISGLPSGWTAVYDL